MLFPAALQEVLDILSIDNLPLPEADGTLLAAVIPWGQGRIGHGIHLENVVAQPGLRARPPVISGVPSDHLKQFGSRSYAIWPWPSGEVPPSTYQLESQHFRDILRSKNTREVDLEGEFRVVFIHAALFRSLDKLSGLSAIRQRPQVQMFSYGTDALLPRQQWGLKPIFPLGGCTQTALFFCLYRLQAEL